MEGQPHLPKGYTPYVDPNDSRLDNTQVSAVSLGRGHRAGSRVMSDRFGGGRAAAPLSGERKSRVNAETEASIHATSVRAEKKYQSADDFLRVPEVPVSEIIGRPRARAHTADTGSLYMERGEFGGGGATGMGALGPPPGSGARGGAARGPPAGAPPWVKADPPSRSGGGATASTTPKNQQPRQTNDKKSARATTPGAVPDGRTPIFKTEKPLAQKNMPGGKIVDWEKVANAYETKGVEKNVDMSKYYESKRTDPSLHSKTTRDNKSLELPASVSSDEHGPPALPPPKIASPYTQMLRRATADFHQRAAVDSSSRFGDLSLPNLDRGDTLGLSRATTTGVSSPMAARGLTPPQTPLSRMTTGQSPQGAGDSSADATLSRSTTSGPPPKFSPFGSFGKRAGDASAIPPDAAGGAPAVTTPNRPPSLYEQALAQRAAETNKGSGANGGGHQLGRVPKPGIEYMEHLNGHPSKEKIVWGVASIRDVYQMADLSTQAVATAMTLEKGCKKMPAKCEETGDWFETLLDVPNDFFEQWGHPEFDERAKSWGMSRLSHEGKHRMVPFCVTNYGVPLSIMAMVLGQRVKSLWFGVSCSISRTVMLMIPSGIIAPSLLLLCYGLCEIWKNDFPDSLSIV